MTDLEKQLLDVARSILADDMLPLLPAEYVAKVRSAIATAEAAATSAQPAPNYPAVPDGWPDESWLINTILKFRIGETPHGIETAQRCARLISRRYNAAMLAAAPQATGKDSLQVQDEPPAPGSGRGVMFIEFLSAQAAKAGRKELSADLLAAIRAGGEMGIPGLPAPAEPACHIAEVSDEEVAIACTPAQRLLLREGMQLYAAPVAGGAIQVRKLGIFGKAYDGPQEKRAYTYTDQPHNVAAWRLGRATAKVSAGGDLIDRGLSLLSTLQAEGFGVFEMADDSLAAGPQEGGEA